MSATPVRSSPSLGRQKRSQGATPRRNPQHAHRNQREAGHLAVRAGRGPLVTQSKKSPSATHRQSTPFRALLGFLQRIWLDAGLNQWAGVASRNWGTCNAQILALFGDGGMNGRPVQEVVHVMRRYEKLRRRRSRLNLRRS